MTKSLTLNRHQIAQLVAQDIPDGSTVNLGIGMPTLVADYLPPDREILMHSENGILGMGPKAQDDDIDPDLINASRVPVTLLPGASITEHTISFAMMRGGHLDYSVLGGFQVAPNGDLANWITDAPDAIPAIGGAMDLAIGAKHVFVTMDHTTKQGEHRLLEKCSYPLTGMGVVDTVYTNLAIVDVHEGKFTVRAIVDGLALDDLQKLTGAALYASPDIKTISLTQEGVPTLV
ncbi:3-oxoadipate CoA-transferase [Pollutimonas nitritireducens]|uniref:3-oxoadipate CoA-transferase n=1 Tax=Pollutimonas nitritireducens TaxID=2045209 RepID=A0A2N4UAP9_9BURK|nr:3-oxoacid CoA-transferase subunit B [Pollutimonas nitritireducens]PLC52095.1 3-oxoadipate CoA-transferase [Pollutimonas nitritireducens]